MKFDIDLFFPVVTPGADAKTSNLGTCRVITDPLFVTLTEQDGQARAITLAELREVDRARSRYTTMRGKVAHPRRIEFPERIFVETPTGHAMALNGEIVARMVRARRQGAPVTRVRW
jgi:hypothetical protein